MYKQKHGQTKRALLAPFPNLAVFAPGASVRFAPWFAPGARGEADAQGQLRLLEAIGAEPQPDSGEESAGCIGPTLELPEGRAY